jgi:predicted RNase H-like nuclease (RuvC/YqgF family)
MEPKHDLTEAVKIVIQSGSIHEALEKSVISKKEAVTETPKIPTPSDQNIETTLESLQKSNSKLRHQIESLQRQLEFEKSKLLQSQKSLKELEKENQQTQRQLNRILNVEQREQRRDNVIQRKNSEIKRLETTIRKAHTRLEAAEQIILNLKLMRQLENRGEVQPLLVLPHFSQEEIRQLKTKYTRKRRKLILIQDPSGGGSSTADQLIQFGVKVIISQGIMSHLALDQFTSAKIPVLDASRLQITMVDEFAVVNIKELEEEINHWQKLHKITEREETADTLERLINEYREERRNQESKRE